MTKVIKAKGDDMEKIINAAHEYGFPYCLIVEFHELQKADIYPREIEKILEKYGKEIFQNIASCGFIAENKKGIAFLLFLPLHLSLYTLKSIMYELGQEKNIENIFLKYVGNLVANDRAIDLLSKLHDLLKSSSFEDAMKFMKSENFSDSNKH